MKDNMRVYFTISSEGVKRKKEICRKIINQIEKLSCKLSLDWIKLATDEKEPLKGRRANPAEIFKENLSALTKAEACIFETSIVSWGVVYQITYAITKKIPTLCLFDKELKASEISNMLPGIRSKYLFLEQYEGDKYLEDKIKDFVSKVEKSILVKVEKSILVKFNFIATKEIKNYIEWVAKKKNISKSEFLRDAIKTEIIDKDREYKDVIL